MFPTVIRPDLLMTDDGFVMTELDSVPGGIGLTAFLNRLYRDTEGVIGADDAMIKNFHASLAALRPDVRNPLVALVVSDEAATYRPEMQWIAHQMQVAGQRVFCMRPEDLFPLGGALFFDVEGNPEKIDIIYRFFELFDLASIPTARFIFDAWASGDVAIAPPMRPFQEEKLAFALFHHHLLQGYWEEALGGRSLKLLRSLIPPTWVMDPAPLPPGAVLDGPRTTSSRRPRRSATSSSRSAASTRPRGARAASSSAATPQGRSGSRVSSARLSLLPGTSTSCRSTGSRVGWGTRSTARIRPTRRPRPPAGCGSARIISWSKGRRAFPARSPRSAPPTRRSSTGCRTLPCSRPGSGGPRRPRPGAAISSSGSAPRCRRGASRSRSPCRPGPARPSCGRCW